MQFRRVYLDNSATTPIDDDVFEAMLPYLQEGFGNASSIHFFGQEARAAVDKARHSAASLINASPNNITFTSGGTEANNLAIRGIFELGQQNGMHIITSQIEHPSVINVCEDLVTLGAEITYLPVYENGIVKVADLKDAIREDTILVSVMFANNEIGTIQPIKEIGEVIKQKRDTGAKLKFHIDAVQAVGKLDVDVEEIGCDLLTFSGHKIYAPKGIGALYARRGVRFKSQILGGHQEREKRGGTENVPQIVAFGKACEIAAADLENTREHLTYLRNLFESMLKEKVPNFQINGDLEKRLQNISNISFASVDGEGLLINLDMQGVAVSTGSACSSGSLDPSPVLLALGQGDARARSAVRFSFGKQNTEEDVKYALEILPKAVESLRNLAA